MCHPEGVPARQRSGGHAHPERVPARQSIGIFGAKKRPDALPEPGRWPRWDGGGIRLLFNRIWPLRDQPRRSGRPSPADRPSGRASRRPPARPSVRPPGRQPARPSARPPPVRPPARPFLYTQTPDRQPHGCFTGSSSLRKFAFANERHPEHWRVRKRVGTGGGWIAEPGRAGQNRAEPGRAGTAAGSTVTLDE